MLKQYPGFLQLSPFFVIVQVAFLLKIKEILYIMYNISVHSIMIMLNPKLTLSYEICSGCLGDNYCKQVIVNCIAFVLVV